MREWIPVSCKLPSSDGIFEVTIKKSRKRTIGIRNFHKDATLYKWGGKWEEQNVIAWRPLDEPYRGN